MAFLQLLVHRRRRNWRVSRFGVPALSRSSPFLLNQLHDTTPSSWDRIAEPIEAKRAMELRGIRLDRTRSADRAGQGDPSGQLRLVALSRSAALEATETHDSFWLALRGDAWINCREGQLALRRGDWIALDRDSRPFLCVGRQALILGLLIPPSLLGLLRQPQDTVVLAGRGRMSRRERQLAFRLWRRTGAFDIATPDGADATGRARQLIQFISGIQLRHGFGELINRCPGRSLDRRRQVFTRMQRACLHLEGNMDRVVRVAELAQLCNFSVWHFTKTFHALFGESPQAVATRFRLQHAAELLATSNLSVSEVGAACGFDHACSFARAFRVRYGTTASEYRERMHEMHSPIPAKPEGASGKAVSTSGT